VLVGYRSAMARRVPAVVLAAGASSRMGAPKGLVVLASGKTLLRAAVEAARGGGADPVIVVLAAGADGLLAEAAAAGAASVENGAAARGRSTSVKAALPHLPSGADGLLLLPVDHGTAAASSVRALLAALADGADVAVPVHAGRRGHPVAVAARLFPSLARLGDDQPLRDALRAPGHVVVEVPVDDPGVIANLDTQADLPPGSRLPG
jgi:molybdenum cofactor cytidylyltransferase